METRDYVPPAVEHGETPPLSIIQDRLIRTADLFSLPDSAYASCIGDAVTIGSYFLHDIEAYPAFFDDPLRMLYTLALGDRVAALGEGEFGFAWDLLSVVAVGKRVDGSRGTLSGYLDRQMAEGMAKQFSLGSLNDESGGFFAELQSCIELFHDTTMSEKAQAAFEETGEGSLLHGVRTKLGVVSPRPLNAEVVVLDLSPDELAWRLGGIRGVKWREGDKDVVVVPGRNNPNNEVLDHEGGHLYGQLAEEILFRGATEAIVESATNNPKTNKKQRAVLTGVEQTVPRFNKSVRGWFRQEAGGIYQILALTDLCRVYGLDGFLALARLSPEDTVESTIKDYGELAGRLLLMPEQVDAVLQSHNSQYRGLSRLIPIYSPSEQTVTV